MRASHSRPELHPLLATVMILPIASAMSRSPTSNAISDDSAARSLSNADRAEDHAERLGGVRHRKLQCLDNLAFHEPPGWAGFFMRIAFIAFMATSWSSVSEAPSISILSNY
jgi:hypothetical protein